MEDVRIRMAKAYVETAKSKVIEANEALELEKAHLLHAYEEVFEEKVCKCGCRITDEELGVDGYFKELRWEGWLLLLVCNMVKQDGTPSRVEKYYYGTAEKLIDKYSNKQ